MPRRSSPYPTEARLEILDVLWEHGPSTVREVHEALQADCQTSVTTTLKIPQVMTEKGLTVRDEKRRPHRYSPSASAEKTQAGLLDDLVQRAFGGSVRKLLVRAVEAVDLKPTGKLSTGWMVILLLAAAVAIPGVALTAPAPPEQTADPAKDSDAQNLKPRILHFPKDRSLGALYVRNADAKSRMDVYGEWSDHTKWEGLGGAVGDVVIPAGKVVRLAVNRLGLRDLSPLSKLRQNDLHSLQISCWGAGNVNADNEIMPHLAGLNGLKVLELEYVNVTHKGLSYLKHLKSLTKLHVTPARASSGRIRTSKRLSNASLVHLSGLDSLKTLGLASPDITDAGLRHLAKLKSLEVIDLSGCKVRGPGLVHLRTLPLLRRIRLNPRLGDAGVKYLKDLPSLKTLSLDECRITDKGLASISKLAGLETLSLFNTQVTDEGLVYLKSLRSLRNLNIRKRGTNKTRITDAGMVHLASIKTLERLDLPNEGITDKGLVHVAKLPKLKHLWVGGSSDSPLTTQG